MTGRREWVALGMVAIAATTILLIFPEKQETILTTMWEYFVEMMMVFPAVMVVMGLFAVWVSKETVVKHLGKTSGVKGFFLSLFLGALPTGPLYVAFPLAASLLKKGARVSNIVIFLSAWSCIKLPQEMVELQFLGVEFMALRLILTVIFVIIMALVIEKVMGALANKKVQEE
ncbi:MULTISPECIES: permease [unclassified Archaeoglobus]|jgi:uncharacterized membrane protein YraQ (UPF0718 family)|uniref:permease n=1 Tax=unclassified Archaeoglobus TaxID=2643606 RepID=UPI0025B9871E|nr:MULTISPECIES: permease [unclassified Archaeoglobus]